MVKKGGYGRGSISVALIGILVFALLALLALAPVFAAEPNGVDITETRTERAPNLTPDTDGAFAGNVTELVLRGYSTTQTWQGYFGNVTGTIQLADANSRVLYNWSLASPQGEIYASTNTTITWINIQCFNFTARGTHGAGDVANGGTTNMNGTNLTQLEFQYNITFDDVDGVNETFVLRGAGTHDTFFTASQHFVEGECLNTRIFSNTGATSNEFEEVLLYEPATTSVVFAAILDEDVLGFDGGAHDFEMLVLENGHGTDISTTTYYFFVELE